MEEILVSEMENNTLELFDEEGKVIEFPIIGMFSLDGKYYVVVYIEQDDKSSTADSELVVLRAEREGDKEYVQIIDDRNEWNRVVSAWNKISNKVVKDGVVPVQKQETK